MRFTLSVLAALALACGSYASGPPGPKTAAERAAAERAASEEPPVSEGKAWGGWPRHSPALFWLARLRPVPVLKIWA